MRKHINTKYIHPNRIRINKRELKVMTDLAAQVIVVGLYPELSQDKFALVKAKQFTQTFISGEQDPYKAFSEICQRVLLVRHWLHENPAYRLNPDIKKWLDDRNPRGLLITGRWYQQMLFNRRKQLLYFFDYKIFPQAILEMAGYPTEEIFNYWHKWFIDHDAEQTYLFIQSVCSRFFVGRNEFHQRIYWVRKPGRLKYRKEYTPQFFPSRVGSCSGQVRD